MPYNACSLTRTGIFGFTEKSIMKAQNATPLLFTDLFDKPIQVTFNEKQTSSDGGAILLEAVSKKMHLLNAFTEAIDDTRQHGKVDHTIEELVRQRLFSIACGYPDANDVKRIEDDPILRMLAGLNPDSSDQSLGSQPTLSRFENAIDLDTCFQIGCRLAEQVVSYQAQRRKGKRKPKSITIDIDPTDDPTHGQQVFSFFNSHYDNWCYLPQAIWIRFNDEGEQYLVSVILRPGNAPATLWTRWVLRRLVELLRQTWRNIRIRVRLDGGFASPHIFDLLEQLRVEYLINMGKNSRLEALAEPLLEQARALASETGQTARVFGEARYRSSLSNSIVFLTTVIQVHRVT
ncbi:MAG: IS1380 family transposase [Planctomycetota bacterium]